jgi:hypothetical protein
LLFELVINVNINMIDLRSIIRNRKKTKTNHSKNTYWSFRIIAGVKRVLNKKKRTRAVIDLFIFVVLSDLLGMKRKK